MIMTAIAANVKREYDGTSPNGNPFNGVWVARAEGGAYLDHDQYRNDLIPRLERQGVTVTLIDKP
jgi:hypothetical protein